MMLSARIRALIIKQFFSEDIVCKFHYLNLYLPSNFPQALSPLSNAELSDQPRKAIDGDSPGQMSPHLPASTL